MATYTGYVQEIKDGKRLKMDDGNWYGAFSASQCSGIAVGDYVSFSYQTTPPKPDGRTFNNIKGNVRKDTSKAPAAPAAKPAAGGYGQKVFPVPALHGDRSIIRQNSLGHAVEIVIHTCPGGVSYEELAEKAIEIARMFEAYSAGDLDAAVAEEAMRKMLATDHF